VLFQVLGGIRRFQVDGDFVDFGGDLACNWLELGEDA